MTFRFSGSKALRCLLSILALQTSVAVALAETPVAAPETQVSASEYDRHMEIGIRLFEDRNYDAAMTEFERAYAAKKVASPLINIALCHKGRFEYPKAVEVLEKVLQLHRDTIDKPEKIEQAVSEIRELLATMTVKVSPTDPSTTLVLDGVELPPGSHERPVAISPGGHTLVVRRDGFSEARTTFRVGSGDRRTIDVALTPSAGKLLIRAEDEEDEFTVSVDGIRRGRSPFVGTFPSGSHLVVIERGETRFTLNVPIVAARETKLEIDGDDFLRMADAPPRGPDKIERPPVRGIYLTAGGNGGLLVGDGAAAALGFDITGGYRVSTVAAFELRVRQMFAIPSEEFTVSNILALTQVGLGARLMTTTMPVRFVQGFGLGFMNDASEEISRQGVFALLEPGMDIDVSNFIFGFSTPVSLSISSRAWLELSGRVHFGYGFW